MFEIKFHAIDSKGSYVAYYSGVITEWLFLLSNNLGL